MPNKQITACYLGVILCILIGYIMFTIGYQSGQIDALSGKQHFKFITNNVPAVVTWQYIK